VFGRAATREGRRGRRTPHNVQHGFGSVSAQMPAYRPHLRASLPAYIARLLRLASHSRCAAHPEALSRSMAAGCVERRTRNDVALRQSPRGASKQLKALRQSNRRVSGSKVGGHRRLRRRCSKLGLPAGEQPGGWELSPARGKADLVAEKSAHHPARVFSTVSLHLADAATCFGCIHATSGEPSRGVPLLWLPQSFGC
jgi:hypothetical protein